MIYHQWTAPRSLLTHNIHVKARELLHHRQRTIVQCTLTLTRGYTSRNLRNLTKGGNFPISGPTREAGYAQWTFAKHYGPLLKSNLRNKSMPAVAASDSASYLSQTRDERRHDLIIFVARNPIIRDLSNTRLSNSSHCVAIRQNLLCVSS